MKFKYCLPIIKNSKEGVLQEILQKKDSYDFLEVWVDYVKDLDEQFVQGLIDQFGGKLIIVLRRQNPEKLKIDQGERLKIISLLRGGRVLLDLDILGQREELEYIKSSGREFKTIVSYHNYRETPDDSKLQEVIDTMKIYNPAIIKIATKCNNPKDGLRLLDLLLKMKEANIRSIILGMGEFGNITRVFGTLWGNEMIFAPKDKNQSSAPGQLTREQLETIFSVLEK